MRAGDETVVAAQGVLASPQVQAFQEIQDQQQAGIKLEKLMRQSFGGGCSPAVPVSGTAPVAARGPGG